MQEQWFLRASATLGLLVASIGRAQEARADSAFQPVPVAAAAEPNPGVPATIEEPPPPFEVGSRTFGILADFGFYSGSGLGVRIGTPKLGVDATFGFLPVLRSYQRGDTVALKYASSYEVGPSVYWLFYQATERTSLGLAVSYKYDNLLGHGGGAGVVLEYELSKKWALRALFGYVVFPDAESRLRSHWDLPADGSLNSGLPWLEGGANAGFAFFP